MSLCVPIAYVTPMRHRPGPREFLTSLSQRPRLLEASAEVASPGPGALQEQLIWPESQGGIAGGCSWQTEPQPVSLRLCSARLRILEATRPAAFSPVLRGRSLPSEKGNVPVDARSSSSVTFDTKELLSSTIHAVDSGKTHEKLSHWKEYADDKHAPEKRWTLLGIGEKHITPTMWGSLGGSVVQCGLRPRA